MKFDCNKEKLEEKAYLCKVGGSVCLIIKIGAGPDALSDFLWIWEGFEPEIRSECVQDDENVVRTFYEGDSITITF